jgi:predicted Zn-dependent protease
LRFDPALPTEGSNVSPTHPLREAAVLVLGVIGVAIVCVASIGVIVDFVAPRIPAAAEVRWFSDWFDVSRPSDVPESRVEALRELLDRINAHWSGQEQENVYSFRIHIWDETEPNALALPGGTIAVTTGLLDAVSSENELAFVLAHELGHFRNRDHLRGLGRGIGLSLLLYSIGIGGGADAAQLAAVAGQLTQRGFDRAQEAAADEFGLGLVVAEYGHTAGATDLFEHLGEDGEVSRLASYLSTHPLHEDRADRLEAVAIAAGWPSSGTRELLDSQLRPAPTPESGREPERENPE